MVGTVEEVLEQLGWEDGFRIPVANEENKRLEKEIDRKNKLKAALTAELESTEGRIAALKKHASNVKLQHEHNQKLLTAHMAQLETENHVYRVCTSTQSNILQETCNFEKEKKEIFERNCNFEKEVAKLLQKVEESKKIIKVDQNRLREWEEMLNRREEDCFIIQRYIKLDAKKFKEMELQRQKLTVELETYRNAIIRAVDEVYEMEIVLDKTAKLYEEALKERRQFIHQWTQSVVVLQQRDNAINDTLREIENLRAVAREKMEVYRESEQFLENQVNNNKEIEEAIKQSERKLTITKDERRKLAESVGTYTTELHTRKKQLEDLGRRTEQIRFHIKQKKKDNENKRIKVQDLTKQIEELKFNFEEISHQKLDVAEKTKQLEEMLKKEDTKKKILMKETKRYLDLIQRSSNRVSELESEKKFLDLQVENERKKIDTLAALQSKEEIRLFYKKDEMYRSEFDVQKSRMKLEKLKGIERDKDELERKQKTIEDLQANLDEKLEVSKLLQTQLIYLENDMKKISSNIAIGNEDLEKLKNKRQDLMLLMEGGEKQLKSIRSNNEEKQVEENILRLKVSQTEKSMNNLDNRVYNLERYGIEMEAAMQERKAEIKVQKGALNVEKRLAQNENAEIRNVLFERKNRIQQLQIRYDKTMSTFGEDENGAPLSTTHLKLQNAQEKYLLQEHGDELDETIRKTEHEIQSMENTLRIVNACNEKFKNSLAVVEEDSPEEMERQKLDEEMYNCIEKMRQKRKALDVAETELTKLRENHMRLLDELERRKEEKEDKERCVLNLERQITEQKAKILRADKSLRRIFRDIQNMCKCTDDEIILLQEKDIRTRELQEQNGLALQYITELTIRHVEAETYVKKLLSEKNITLPCTYHLKPTPASSIRGSSGNSSAFIKSSSRSSSSSNLGSSRESIGCVINVEACFDSDKSTGRSSNQSNSITKYGSRASERRSYTAKKS